ncbi:innexin inx2-like [Ornithodoros turicata]|uniref:innexin inx2-like n=1 Tax=Ornithodoros turicata TaxID=34597 RepID=UPI003139E5DB
MDQLFGSLKAVFKTDFTVIDNHIFRLHYRVTVCILVAFSIVVTARQYIGDPIDCYSFSDVPKNVLDTFCWIHTTFSLPHAWKKRVGSHVPYPGVDTYVPGQKRVYHAYYQWVCFVLFLQALLFYTPHYFWKAVEGGRIKTLLLDLDKPVMAPAEREKRRGLLVGYLIANVASHNTLFFSYALAEILNLANVIGQMFLIDRLLGGEFLTYGVQVLQFTEWDSGVRFDPMVKIFPRMTKCTFYDFGTTGDVQKFDALCILPINVINEKIYIFLWFWFVFLAVLSTMALLYRAIILLFPVARYLVMRCRNVQADKDYVANICKATALGDWFVLDILCKNMDSANFRELVDDYYVGSVHGRMLGEFNVPGRVW